MSRRRFHPPLDPEDLRLWEQVKQSVRPLRVRLTPQRLAVAKPADMPTPPAIPVTVQAEAPPATRPKLSPPPPGTIDRPIRRKLTRGREALPARIDLHGLRQEEAHRRLLSFLRDAQLEGVRFVLVITGKGGPDLGALGDGRGVLRRAVPRWLGLPEFRTLVVGFDWAGRTHGGEGALYVQLRRPRER